MRVAMLALHSSPVDALGSRDAGGMSVVLQELSAALARRGHRVDLFTCRGHARPGAPVELAPGVQLHRLDAGGAESVPKELLHRHASAAAAELRALAATAGLSYHLVHSHYWLSGITGQEVARAWGVPHLVTFHTLGAAKDRLACGEDVPRRRLAAERGLATDADRVVVSSVREAGEVTEYCGDLGERLRVVGWGVDRVRFCPGDRAAARAEWGLDGGQPVLVFVGRHVPVKGLDLLLASLLEVRRLGRSIRLLVAGGEAAPLGSGERDDTVTWLGPVGRERMPQLYRAADALVVPSRYESFGLAALEALSCGTPVVATRVGVLDEVVRSGVNGRLAEAPTPQALAHAIRSQLEAAPVAPEAVRASVAKWSWERAAVETESVYREVVEDER